MNYGGPSQNNGQQYGQQTNQPTNYYNMPQQPPIMRKFSTSVAPDQMMISQQASQQQQMPIQRKCSTVVTPDQMMVSQQVTQQQQMSIQRKCSTVVTPDQLRLQQQQMMPPPAMTSSPNAQHIQQRRFSQQQSQHLQSNQMSSMPPPQQHVSPNFNHSPSQPPQPQMMHLSSNQHQMTSGNQQQISPSGQQMFPGQQQISSGHQQISPNTQQNQMIPMNQMSIASNQQQMSQGTAQINSINQTQPILNFVQQQPINQMNGPQNQFGSGSQMPTDQGQTMGYSQIPNTQMPNGQMPNGQMGMGQDQMNQGQTNMSQNMQMNRMTPQHKLSLQHQNSLPPPVTQQQQHISPVPTNQQANNNYGNQTSIGYQNNETPPVQHKFSLQHQQSFVASNMPSSMANQQQQQQISPSQQYPSKNYQSSNNAFGTSSNSFKDSSATTTSSTPPPQLQSYKMDTSASNSNSLNINTSFDQQMYPSTNGNAQMETGRQQHFMQQPNMQQQNNYNQQQRPTATDDFYVRNSDYYYQDQQPWRKASLACNFRLNPTTRKESSISPNFPNYNRQNYDPYATKHMGPANNQSRTVSCAFNASNKQQTPAGGNLGHRSQSLSAAEFLRRHGPAEEENGLKNPGLRRFESQLRSHKLSTVGLKNHPSLSTLYTPPPMLSPLRSGTGLYRSISRQERKISSLAALSLKRMDSTTADPSTSTQMPPNNVESDVVTEGGVSRKTSNVPVPQPAENDRKKSKPHDYQMPVFMDQMDLEQARATLTGRKPFIRPPMDNRANAPQRKNGLFLSGAAQGSDGKQFAAELEALRKESASSTQSNQENASRRMSIVRNSKLSTSMVPNHDDVLRKLSNTSIDEPLRKVSSTSDNYYDYSGLDSDITPHINLGKAFQARVKKWSPREITNEEREAIPDRDDLLFSHKVIEHIPQRSVAAYEALACSQAVPRPGRNKELALHILMENQGNLQAAVMDLLRSDTLDWEQYPIIFNNLYQDVDNWSPEEIASFQDAIYKSEKDFHQVAAELGNRTVKQCVNFYYTWKKCCPDDYRKLRNLRRKRLLLEQQIDYTNFSERQRTQSATVNDISDEESDTGLDSDATSIASVNNIFNRPYSPYEDTRGEKHPRLSFGSPLDQLKASTSQPQQQFVDINAMKQQQQQQQHNEQQNPVPNTITSTSASNFPWLHGEFPSSPGSSNANSSYSQPPSVGSMAMDLFNTDNGGGMSMLHQKAHRQSSAANKKGAQPQADGFFHCRLCEKRFEKVKSLNAHMKSHAMKARAEAEANAQIQHKHQQKAMQMPQQSPLSMALGAAVRLQQQQQGNSFLQNPQQQRHDTTDNERSPNSPLGFLSPAQQQNQALLRLFGPHNPFTAAQQLAAASVADPSVSQAMSALTNAQFTAAFGQQPTPDLQTALAQMPTTQATNQNAAAALELHLQQNHLQHSATIMH